MCHQCSVCGTHMTESLHDIQNRLSRRTCWCLFIDNCRNEWKVCVLFKTVFAGFFFFKYVKYANISILHQVLWMWPLLTHRCFQEKKLLALMKLRFLNCGIREKKKKGNRGVILEINDRSQDTKTQKPWQRALHSVICGKCSAEAPQQWVHGAGLHR